MINSSMIFIHWIVEYEEQIVQSLAGRKNIIYLNKPRDIERFALALAELLPNISDPEIDNACTHIGQYMQPQYLSLIHI